jgi:hypothetical protein
VNEQKREVVEQMFKGTKWLAYSAFDFYPNCFSNHFTTHPKGPETPFSEAFANTSDWKA